VSRKMRKALTTASLALVVTITAHLTPLHAQENAAVGPQLSERLRTLLREEMNLVQGGMERVMRAIAVGDHDAVFENGRNIYKSFILDQQMTEQDRHELMAAVPTGFLELDHAFHDTAHKLARAGRDRDVELQAFYFSRLVESCAACHSRYATDRFPGLRHLGETEPAHHHH
jgi:hypothetical protein